MYIGLGLTSNIILGPTFSLCTNFKDNRSESKVSDGKVWADLGLWQGEVQKALRDHGLRLILGCT